ncbi:MAG TPA: carbohydrate kinase family protein [Ignavibacteriaceae bacterium]
MNILVIGHSVVDKIIDKGSVSIKPGGIFYTIVSFLSQMQREDKLFLCTTVDEMNETLFKDFYNLVEKDFIFKVDSIPKVELIVDDIGERKETYSQISQNLTLPKDNLNRFDGILINMISGYDISLPQLIELRKNYNELIYFDVHTFSRGIDKNLKRNFRRIENFDQWAECIDILQSNESELLTVSDKKDEFQIIEELFSFGIQQVIITRAEKGATVYFKENDIIRKLHKDALQVNLISKVGCGDVFGAVYFYNYIKNKNVTLTIEKANLFAGISTTYSDVKEYFNLNIDANKQIDKK